MRVLSHQSFFDLSLQEFGTIESVFDLAINNGLSITSSLRGGQYLKIPEAIKNDSILSYMKSNSVNPISGFTGGQLDNMGESQESIPIEVNGKFKYPISSGSLLNIQTDEYSLVGTDNPWIILFTQKTFSKVWTIDLSVIGWEEAVIVDVFDLQGESFIQGNPRRIYNTNLYQNKVLFPYGKAKGNAYVLKVR